MTQSITDGHNPYASKERSPEQIAAEAETRWRTIMGRAGNDPAAAIDLLVDNIAGPAHPQSKSDKEHYGAWHNNGDTARQLAEQLQHDIPQTSGRPFGIKSLRERIEERLAAQNGQKSR